VEKKSEVSMTVDVPMTVDAMNMEFQEWLVHCFFNF
jgi:hypothetical protein